MTLSNMTMFLNRIKSLIASPQDYLVLAGMVVNVLVIGTLLVLYFSQ